MPHAAIPGLCWTEIYPSRGTPRTLRQLLRDITPKIGDPAVNLTSRWHGGSQMVHTLEDLTQTLARMQDSVPSKHRALSLLLVEGACSKHHPSAEEQVLNTIGLAHHVCLTLKEKTIPLSWTYFLRDRRRSPSIHQMRIRLRELVEAVYLELSVQQERDFDPDNDIPF